MVQNEQPKIQLESPRQLAERIGWPVGRIRKLIQTGRIKHILIGRSILVPIDAVEEFLSDNLVQPEIRNGSTCEQKG